MVFRNERNARCGSEFPHAILRCSRGEPSGARFSVALPLGINGGVRAVGNRLELPHIAELCADGRPGGTATLDAQAACCGPPVGRRPARAALRAATALLHSSPHSFGFGLRAPRVGRRPSAQAQRFYEPQKLSSFILGALFVLSLSSPPAGSATSPVELQSAAWGGGELRGSKSRKSSAQICQIRRPKGRTSTA